MLMQLRERSAGLNILIFVHTRSGTINLKYVFKSFPFHQ